MIIFGGSIPIFCWLNRSTTIFLGETHDFSCFVGESHHFWTSNSPKQSQDLNISPSHAESSGAVLASSGAGASPGEQRLRRCTRGKPGENQWENRSRPQSSNIPVALLAHIKGRCWPRMPSYSTRQALFYGITWHNYKNYIGQKEKRRNQTDKK